MSVLSKLRSFRGSEGGRGRPAPRSRPAVRHFRPTLEGLEDRRVMNFGMLPQDVLGSAIAAALQTPPTVALNFTGVSVQNGQLVAQGFLQGLPFTANLSVSAAPGATASNPILDLHLNALHLDLLGLDLDTSNICLTITAQPGTPLGNLVTGLLGGQSLGNILGGMSAADLNTLTSQLTGILNGVAGQLTSASSISALPGHPHDLLHLSLGPLDLNLLGLNVHLDNCANGPVTIDLSADRNGLLGRLFSDVEDLLQGAFGRTLTDQFLTTLADDVLLLL